MPTRSLALPFILVSASLATAGAARAAESPQQFITDAIKGDNSEIALGQLAQQKGGTDQVRNLGKTLVDDHTAARAQATDVARTMNITAPTDATDDGRAEHDKLSGMSGDAFDREFVGHVIADHDKDIADYQAEARDDHGAVGQLATQQLPTLQRHLQMAQAISGPGKSTMSAPPITGFQSQEASDTWRASKLTGVPVFGPNNDRVGDINDVLMDHDGRATAVIIGVGGFLGLGEKNVSVPFADVKFTDRPVTANANTAPANSAQDGVVGGSAVGRQSSTTYPDHGVISLTANQLKAAPSFQYAR